MNKSKMRIFFINTLLHNKFFSAFVAFLLWGSWAYFVNVGNNKYSGIVSGLSQGIASFVITLAMIQSVAYFYHRINGDILKIFFPSVITTSITCMFLIIVHHYAGTHHIFKTIFPALCVGFMFCLYTTYSLNVTNKNKDTNND